MCGICGFTGQPEQRETVIRNMTEVITHRGPDADGFYTDDAICIPALVHHRPGCRPPAYLQRGQDHGSHIQR